MDDTVQQMMFLGPDDLRREIQGDLGMFEFLNGDPVRNSRLVQLGILPWWTDPEIRLSFSRPLAEITHRLDFFLWPQSAVAMHAHNLVWFGWVLFVVALLYRAIEGPGWVAALAGLLYAMDDARSLPVAWIANRNALIATTFGVLSLLFHQRWRGNGQKRDGVLATLFFLASLLSAEIGVGASAYLLAFALCLERDHLWERMKSLAPYLIVGVAWFIYYRLNGFGASGSGFYIDPGREPFRFFLSCLERAPILLLGQWFVPPANLSLLLSQSGHLGVVVFGWLSTCFLGWLLYPLLKSSPQARFWALGSVLSIPPVCSVIPADRLLFFVGIGGHALLALWLVSVFGTSEGRDPNRFKRVAMKGFASLLIVLHLVLAPVGLWFSSMIALPAGEKPIRETARSLAKEGDMEGRSVLILNTPSPILSSYLGPRLFVEGYGIPENIWSLSPGIYPLSIERPDTQSLILGVPGSFLLPPGAGLPGGQLIDVRYLHQNFATLYRNLEDKIAIGESISMGEWSIEVTEIGEGNQPREITLRFNRPIEEMGMDWYRWEENRVIPYALPEVGEKEKLAAVGGGF